MAVSDQPTILLADIGGTNCRFAVLGADGRPQRIHSFVKHEAPDFAAAVAHFLAKTGVRPEAGVLALAGPVSGDLITLTNRSWQFRLSEIATRIRPGRASGAQ